MRLGCILPLGADRKGGGQMVYWPIVAGATVLLSICIVILYKSPACSMGLSEMDVWVYNKQGTSLCKCGIYCT